MNAEGMPYRLRAILSSLSDWYAWHYRFVLCASVGAGVRVERPRHLNLSGPGIHIGNHVEICAQPDAKVHLSCWPYGDGESHPSLRLGDYCSLSPGVRLIVAQDLQIGPSCILAANVYVTDADWHDRYHRVFPPGAAAPVRLERNVWLGDGAKVLKGVTIGENTIVGAGAVVVSDLPANCIAAGNPARVVAKLDSETTTTDRQGLFEELAFERFSEQFWRDRLAQNSWWGWLAGLVWPACRPDQRSKSRER